MKMESQIELLKKGLLWVEKHPEANPAGFFKSSLEWLSNHPESTYVDFCEFLEVEPKKCIYVIKGKNGSRECGKPEEKHGYCKSHLATRKVQKLLAQPPKQPEPQPTTLNLVLRPFKEIDNVWIDENDMVIYAENGGGNFKGLIGIFKDEQIQPIESANLKSLTQDELAALVKKEPALEHFLPIEGIPDPCA